MPVSSPKLFSSRELSFPNGGASSTPRSWLYLQTQSVAFTVNGASYSMTLAANKQIGQPATVDVSVARGSDPGFSEQDYDYTFAAGAIGFTGSLSTVATAHLTSGGSAAPSKIDLTYTATPGQVDHSSCTLTNGTKTQYVSETRGTISVSSFGLATGSSFFGTLTTKPVKAALDYDPGCKQGSEQVTIICPGPAVLGTSTGGGAPVWAVSGFHRTNQGYSLVGTTHNVTSSLTVVSELFRLAHTTDMLPNATFTQTGATATWTTTGDPFLSGSATFTSTTPPVKSKPHSCSDYSDFSNHTYVLHVYRGTLSPTHGAPLTALFDTGTFPFTAQPAQLWKVIYTS